MPQLILASGSDGRKKLLEQAGYKLDKVLPQDVDETAFNKEQPRDYVMRITKAKFTAAVQQNPNDISISADTVPVTGRRIFQKPETPEEAHNMASHFSGRKVKIITCVFVGNAQQARFRTIVSSAKIKRLSDQEINDWLVTKDWVGVSGGIKLQGLSSIFIQSIQGSYTNIVGLPMTETYNLLKYFGVFPEWQKK